MARLSLRAQGTRVAGAKNHVKVSHKEAGVVALSSVRTIRVPKRLLPSLEFGRVVLVDSDKILVEVARIGSKQRLARTLVGALDLEPGDQVLVAVVGNEDPDLVILGRLFNPSVPVRDIRINGRRVSIDAESELVLKCASATIRIGRDGLIAVRGDRVTSQARGTNRIRGGSVEIN